MKRMDDEELKRLLKEGMEYEADLIMKEVESDPNMADVVAPEAIYDNLWKQIREQQATEEQENNDQKKEEEELIRLGKKYKKKLGRRKYYILIAAIVCIFGIGTVSIGDGKKVFQEAKRKLGDREQSLVNTTDEEGNVVDEISSEEEAYQQIEEEFGFYPVKLIHLPEEIEFNEVVIEDDIQSARIYYSDGDMKLISYYIVTNHREGSTSADVEDTLVQEYLKEINGVTMQFQEYQVGQSETIRMRVLFEYGSAQYIITMTGIEQTEVQEIVTNLYFS